MANVDPKKIAVDMTSITVVRTGEAITVGSFFVFKPKTKIDAPKTFAKKIEKNNDNEEANDINKISLVLLNISCVAV